MTSGIGLYLSSGGEGGGGRILGAHHRFFGKLTANELPVRGGVIKRFQSLSGDQVNFMVTIRILRPPIGSCNFFVFAKFTRAY